jgi:hypothetical protein
MRRHRQHRKVDDTANNTERSSVQRRMHFAESKVSLSVTLKDLRRCLAIRMTTETTGLMLAPPLVTENSLCCLKRLLLDQFFAALMLESKHDQARSIAKPYSRVEGYSKVASMTTPVKNDCSEGKLHYMLDWCRSREDFRKPTPDGSFSGFPLLEIDFIDRFSESPFWTQWPISYRIRQAGDAFR